MQWSSILPSTWVASTNQQALLRFDVKHERFPEAEDGLTAACTKLLQSCDELLELSQVAHGRYVVNIVNISIQA